MDQASRTVRSRIYLLLLVGVVNLIVGSVGYMSIGGYPLLEALYMSLTTMLTVGYGEILPLKPAARLFNMAFMTIAVIAELGAIAMLTQALLEWEVAGGFGLRRKLRTVRDLKDHYIVCGYGRVGRGAAEELQRSGSRIVIVDRDADKLRTAESLGYLTFQGDSTRDETLRAVGIERAKGVIATLGSDADNLFLVISARALNPGVPVVARAVEEEAIDKLRRAGATDVRAPFRATGQRLASSLTKPHVVEFLDVALVDELNIGIHQLAVAPHSLMAGRTLADLRLRDQLKVSVLGIRRKEGVMEFNPEGNTVIHEGDNLIVMGDSRDLHKLDQMAGASA